MHSLTVDCESFTSDEKVAMVVPVTSVEVEVTCSEAMLALSFSTLWIKCLMKRLEISTLRYMVGIILGRCLFESALIIWCSSFQEDTRAILSVYNWQFSVCTTLETVCFVCLLQVIQNCLLCVPPFPFCLTSFSLSYKKFTFHWLKPWRAVVINNFPQWRGWMLI